MRELKFRAWDTKQKKMLNGVSIGTIKVWDENTPLLSNEFNYNEDCIFEQYTGLKDKNGKEIYEGDIVRCYSRRKSFGDYQVIWNEDCGGFECESLKPLVDGGDRMLKDVRVFCEIATQFRVVGNIHENPELLKEEE